MQRQQILELPEERNYKPEIKLTEEVRTSLKLWVQNLNLSNGRSIISYPPQLIIISTASDTSDSFEYRWILGVISEKRLCKCFGTESRKIYNFHFRLLVTNCIKELI